MKIKRITGLAILGIFISSFTIYSQNLKFGHVNVADIILLMPEYQNISKIMDEEATTLENQFTAMREELNNIELEYEKNYETYTAEQRQSKEQEYSEIQQRVQEFYVNAQQTLQMKQEELQIPVLNKLFSVIKEVGDDNGYLYIFEVNSGLTVFQSNLSTDVTPLVKEKLGI